MSHAFIFLILIISVNFTLKCSCLCVRLRYQTRSGFQIEVFLVNPSLVWQVTLWQPSLLFSASPGRTFDIPAHWKSRMIPFCTFHVTVFKPKHSRVCTVGSCAQTTVCTKKKSTFQVRVFPVVYFSSFNIYNVRHVCLHPIPVPVAGCKSLLKSEFKKWHKWNVTIKNQFGSWIVVFVFIIRVND